MLASHPPALADKVAIRRLGRERRKAFIEGLRREDREQLEAKLAEVLAPLLVNSHVVGGYCPLPSEISPFPALEAALGGVVEKSRLDALRDDVGEFNFDGALAKLAEITTTFEAANR